MRAFSSASFGRRVCRRGEWVATLVAVSVAALPSGARAQEIPRARPLAPAEAQSTTTFRSVAQVHVRSDGTLLVHDAVSRRVAWVSRSLDSMRVIADGENLHYRSRLGGLLPLRGDTALFIDPQILAMWRITPEGERGPVLPILAPPYGNCLLARVVGAPAALPDGRILCRMPPQVSAGSSVETFEFSDRAVADSTPLVRLDLERWGVDTVAMLAAGRLRTMAFARDSSCAWSSVPVYNPLGVVDDWTVDRNGTITIVRGSPYAAERYGASARGPAPSRGLLPYAARRLSQRQKVRVLDSVRAVFDAARAGMPRDEPASRCGEPGLTVRFVGATLAEDRGQLATLRRVPRFRFADLGELPDTAQPFEPPATRADLDGNVWVRLRTQEDRGWIYDVIDAQNRLAARIRLAPGREVVGFGSDGVVVLAAQEGDVMRLERTRYR